MTKHSHNWIGDELKQLCPCGVKRSRKSADKRWSYSYPKPELYKASDLPEVAVEPKKERDLELTLSLVFYALAIATCGIIVALFPMPTVMFVVLFGELITFSIVAIALLAYSVGRHNGRLERR